ncbi:MAG TPA: bis(5'-nucleosyl)-tetraphosphatase (symmetrical) YqeK [Dehalococcoidia bacterium]|jgi:predicted HD superfamily hydrolase involved in NAD metabolism
MNETEELLRAALTKVPSALAEHVVRVVDEAVRLADVHGVDRDAARIAALGHDILRAHSPERLLRIADEQSFAVDDEDRMEPILMHGPLAVAVLREQYKVLDADVLGAVAAHTTARPGMTRLQKLIFVADKIEPHKMGGRPQVMRVSDFAETDLDAAMRAYLDYQIESAVQRGWPVHRNTVAARNELIEASRRASAK